MGRGEIRLARLRPAGQRAGSASRTRRARLYSTSSTSTVSPVTRCDKAAAMKRSRSPSSTSPGRGRRHPGAQVLDQLIGLQHVGADLVAPADFGLGGIGGVGLRFALLQLGLVQPRLQLLHRRGAVLVLGALVLAGDDDPGGNMGDPDRAVGRVDVLPACARRAIGVDPQIGFVDLDSMSSSTSG